MKRVLVSTIAAVGILFPQAAGAGTGTTFDFGAAYRTDKFDWNIASNLSGVATPNIASELTWDSLGITQIEAGLETGRDDIIFRIRADYGWILSGNNQDSDFNGNNRTLEFSRSNNDGGAGNVWDVSTAVGYRLGEDAYVMPLAGWAIHRQNLRIRNGVQTIPATGAIAGLNSSYDAQWTGPWLGLEAGMVTKGDLRLAVDVAYQFATYSAEANWNLRADLAHPVSFRHDATGYGMKIGASVQRRVRDGLTLTGGIDYRKWKADNGVDTFFSAAGGASSQRLNEVNWQSFTVRLDAVYAF